jgi:hypothetical protein
VRPLSPAACDVLRKLSKTGDHHLSIWCFLPEVYSTRRTDDGFLAPDADAKFAAHPLARDQHRRQERDLNDVKRMVEERCSIVDIVEHLEKRSKAESKAEALNPIRSGNNDSFA